MYKKIIFTSSFGDTATFKIDCMSTPEQLSQGLQGVKFIPDNYGMLFIFPMDAIQSMWMKDTLIPLDMIFIDENLCVVDVIENTTPKSMKGLSADCICKYVLEVNAGLADSHGIKFGDKVELS